MSSLVCLKDIQAGLKLRSPDSVAHALNMKELNVKLFLNHFLGKESCYDF